MARAGDTSALDDGYYADRAKVENWAYENGGFQRLNVTGTDYGLQGVPKSLKAGKVAVRLKNEGKEFHVVFWLERAAVGDGSHGVCRAYQGLPRRRLSGGLLTQSP